MIISPWLAFFPERLPVEKTDAIKIAEERENEAAPQTPKEWIKELVKFLMFNRKFLSMFVSGLYPYCC